MPSPRGGLFCYRRRCACRIFQNRKKCAILKQDKLTGKIIPRFTYDTPTRPQADFYALCDDDRPLILVFLPNYGHPVSRVYLTNYVDTLDMLKTGRIACVVRSNPRTIAQSLNGEFPFPLICDAQGVLYDYFEVEKTTSRMSWSFAAAKIFREAKKQGYVMEKNSEQQLPLTLVVGRGGRVLFAHYGESLTDLPEDCIAMESVCRHLLAAIEKDGPAAAADAADWAEDEEDLAQALAVGNAADDAPEQDAPDLDAASHDVLFPGVEQPAARPEPPAHDDGDTTQIDLGSWQTGAAQEQAPAGERKWGRLLGLFAQNQDDPEDD